MRRVWDGVHGAGADLFGRRMHGGLCGRLHELHWGLSQHAERSVELRSVWKTLQNALEETADSTNFQQLLDQATDKEKMYYI